MSYNIGDKIGATVCGSIYVGTISSLDDNFYYIDIEGCEKGFCLNKIDDVIKPVCKSRSIVYV